MNIGEFILNIRLKKIKYKKRRNVYYLVNFCENCVYYII